MNQVDYFELWNQYKAEMEAQHVIAWLGDTVTAGAGYDASKASVDDLRARLRAKGFQ